MINYPQNQNWMNFQTHIASRFQSIVHSDNGCFGPKAHRSIQTDFQHNSVDNDKYLNMHRLANMGYIDND